MSARPALVLVALSLILGIPCSRAIRSGVTLAAQAPTLSADEQVLATSGPDTREPVRIAGDRVVWRAERDKRWTMMINGQPFGPTADGMGEPMFSRDGKHLGFTVLRDGKETLFVDGVERGAVDNLRAWVFAPDNESIFWVACRPQATAQRCRAQRLGGPDGPEHAGIRSFFVSAGAPPRLAYEALDDGRWTMIVDGQGYTPLRFTKGPVPSPYDAFTFSPDGRRFAYMWQGVGMQAVVDGKTDLDLARLAGTPRFSPDGKRLAYAVVDFKGTSGFLETPEFRGRIFVDGKQVSAVDSKRERRIHTPHFGHDNLPIAHDGLDPAWAGVSDPVFSPDSQKVAWAIRTGDKAYRLAVDGQTREFTVERFLAGPVFSPDSRKVAFVGRVGDHTVVVIDGVVVSRLPGRDDEFAENLTFSPDGEHLAFVLGRGDTPYWGRLPSSPEPPEPRRVVLDGVAGPELNAEPILQLLFSSDGKHLAYVAYIGTFGNRGFRSVVVLDGHVSEPYAAGPDDPSALLFWTTLSFSGPARVSCVARKQTQYVRATFTRR